MMLFVLELGLNLLVMCLRFVVADNRIKFNVYCNKLRRLLLIGFRQLINSYAGTD